MTNTETQGPVEMVKLTYDVSYGPDGRGDAMVESVRVTITGRNADAHMWSDVARDWFVANAPADMLPGVVEYMRTLSDDCVYPPSMTRRPGVWVLSHEY